MHAAAQMLPLTADHRIDTNLREQQRVTASGGLITNVDRSGAVQSPELELVPQQHRLGRLDTKMQHESRMQSVNAACQTSLLHEYAWCLVLMQA